MAITRIVSDKHNTYFTNNNITVGNAIPTSGTYAKGDIVVNIGENSESEAMWICIESGTPGTWQVLGTGGGASRVGTRVSNFTTTVIVSEPVTEVSLAGLGTIVGNGDKLLVHFNSTYLMEGVDYEIVNGSSIVKLDLSERWNESSEPDSVFAFELIKLEQSFTSDVIMKKAAVIVNEPVNEISLEGLEIKVGKGDKLLVHFNSVHLMEGMDYEISAEGDRIIKIGEGNWNESSKAGCLFSLELFKNIEFSLDGEGVTVGTKLVGETNNVVISEPCTEVEIGLDFDNTKDMLMVFKNSTYMVRGIGYEINGNKIVSMGEVWNENGIEEYNMTFVVMKEMSIVNPDMTIGMGQLSNDVKNTINDLVDTVGNQNTSLGYMDSRLETIENEYATKEDLGNIEVDLSPYQQKTDNNLQTSSKDVIGAINELFQSANNGKELIANAIGEPLNAEDTFSAMSNDINGLLSTFKTNMMNNGILVESGDKFKQLIDKIATMVEEGEGKGIQYVSGNGNSTSKCEVSLNFKPILVLVQTGKGMIIYLESYSTNSVVYAFYDMYVQVSTLASTGGYINETGFCFGQIGGASWFNWYAIGVGEEDTSLRDSLANILEEEGVEITEEDDMASLITKVDEEFEDTRNTLAGLMQAGGYDVKGNEDTNTLLELLTASGIEINSIKQISCGFNHILLLKNDGSVWACGRNYQGQLGLGTSGDNTNQTTFTQVTTNINNDVKHIYCGHYHSFIIKNDGSLWACGQNYNGQLGLGNTTGQSVFTQVTTNINNDVKQVAGGNNHTFKLKNDGSIWSCGYNGKGQLGLGTIDTNNTHTTFTQVTTNINNDVKQIACGDQHTVILKNDGSVWACGYNSTGQLGVNDSSDRSSFTKVTTNINNDVKEVHCGHESTFTIKNNGSLWATGNNAYGQLGLGNTSHKSTFTQVTVNASDIKQIACGSYHTFILKNDGSLYSCGWNQGGLGVTDTSADLYSSFTLISGGDHSIRSVDCGYGFSYVIKNNGELWSCGYNDYGNLGLGHKTTTWSFTYLTPIGKTF